MASPADDQVRADVERALHGAVEMMFALPQALARRARRCLVTPMERAVAPVQLIRSFTDLALGRLTSPAEDDIGSPRPEPAATPPSAAADSKPSRPSRAAVTAVTTDARDETTDAPVTGEADTASDDAEADGLPIEQYESLAASHVVARLDALTSDELWAVRAFETAHRGRRTVLGKIDQLLAADA